MAVEQRAVGAILGSIITDAAGAAIEWVYDADKLNNEILAGGKNPEFLEKSYNPFFTVPSGKNSYYGEQVYVLLESLVEAKGWNKEVYRNKLFKWFGPGTAYDHEANGIDLTKRPINAPWQSSIMKSFVNHYQGKGEMYKDAMIETASQVAPLVALYAGKPELEKYLKEFSQTLQDNEIATEICVSIGLFLEGVILNGPSKEAANVFFEKGGDVTKAAVKEVRETKAKNLSCVDGVGQFGRHCGALACFKSGLFSLSFADKDFVLTNRESLRSGGDICGRGCWVGGFLGAWNGLDKLPKDWIEKTDNAQKTLTLAKELVKLR